MSKKVAIVSGKGGIGKTMLTANLGRALANQGKRVLMVDMDFGVRNLDLAFGLGDSIVYDLWDTVEGGMVASDVLIEVSDRLSFIPASQTKSLADFDLDKLKSVMDKLCEEYDFILLDGKTGINQDTAITLSVADEVIVMVDPTHAGIRDGDRLKGMIDKSNIEKSHLVINGIRPNLIRDGKLLDFPEIVKILPLNLLGLIPYDEDVLVAYDNGVALDGNSDVFDVFMNIAGRLMGYDIAYCKFHKDVSFFENIKRLFKRR